jgi:hypothetical protein
MSTCSMERYTGSEQIETFKPESGLIPQQAFHAIGPLSDSVQFI